MAVALRKRSISLAAKLSDREERDVLTVRPLKKYCTPYMSIV